MGFRVLAVIVWAFLFPCGTALSTVYGLLGVTVFCTANFALAYGLNKARKRWRRERITDGLIPDSRMLEAQRFIREVREKK